MKSIFILNFFHYINYTMNTEALFLFLILLLGLLLCSFLGGNCYNEGFTNTSPTTQVNNNTNNNVNRSNTGVTSTSTNYDNYNHYNKTSSQLTTGSTFYGPNGSSVVVNANSDGSQSLQVTLPGSSTPLTFNPSDASSNNVESYVNYNTNNGSATVFRGPNGETATVITTDNGQYAINVQTSSGSYTYTQSGSYYNPNNTSSTQYYGSTGTPIQPNNTAYQGPAGPYGNNVGGPAQPYQGPAGPYGNNVGGPAQPYQGPAGPYDNNGVGTNDYYNSLPQGIPRSQIPPGQEDLYILKSEIVPPVCPACPIAAACPRQEPCAPCPPCGRCPEPSFECKKVPNYSALDNAYLPVPVLNDFSTFGM